MYKESNHQCTKEGLNNSSQGIKPDSDHKACPDRRSRQASNSCFPHVNRKLLAATACFRLPAATQTLSDKNIDAATRAV